MSKSVWAGLLLEHEKPGGALVRPDVENVAGFVCIRWIFRCQQQVCEYNTLVFHDRRARRQLVFDPLRRLQQCFMCDSEMNLLERFLEQRLWPSIVEIRVLDGDPERAALPCVASYISPLPLRVAVSSLLLVITAYRFGSRNLQAILDAIRSTLCDHPKLETASARFMGRFWAWQADLVRTCWIPPGQLLLSPGRFFCRDKKKSVLYAVCTPPRGTRGRPCRWVLRGAVSIGGG